MQYREELVKAMKLLSSQENTIFLGQGVVYSGHGMFPTLINVPMEKRVELPVMEDAQLGISIGLALGGYLPISIYPRMDFLIIAMNQLVNHLDKIEDMSEFKPKVIIRTAVGSTKPLYPGLQHCQDYTKALYCLLKNVNVIKLDYAEDIMPTYRFALADTKSSILIEMADLYNA